MRRYGLRLFGQKRAKYFNSLKARRDYIQNDWVNYNGFFRRVRGITRTTWHEDIPSKKKNRVEGIFKEAVQNKLVDMLSRIRTESQYFKFAENWSPAFLKGRYPKAFKMMKIIQSNLGLIEGGVMNDVRGEVGGVMDKVAPYTPWVVAGLAVLTAGYFIFKPKDEKPPIVLPVIVPTEPETPAI